MYRTQSVNELERSWANDLRVSTSALEGSTEEEPFYAAEKKES